MVSRRSIIGYLSIILLSTIPHSPMSSMLFYAPVMSKIYRFLYCPQDFHVTDLPYQ